MLRLEIIRNRDNSWTVIQGDFMGIGLCLGEMLEAVTHAAYTESSHRYLDPPERLAVRLSTLIDRSDSDELKAIHAHLSRIKAAEPEPEEVDTFGL